MSLHGLSSSGPRPAGPRPAGPRSSGPGVPATFLPWVRLTLRLNGFEVGAFGLVLGAFVVATVVAAAQIDALRPPPACLSEVAAPPPSCAELGTAWYRAQNSVLGLGSGLAIFAAFTTALFLGVPIVAREVERGTARLAWSLAPSRIRWFVGRLLPVLVLVALAGLVTGAAVDRFVGALAPTEDLSKSFNQFGLRGGLIASRAVFIFAVAVLVGSVTGRVLPAALIAAVVASVGLAGGERVNQMILEREAIVRVIDWETGDSGSLPGDLFIDQKFVLPDGSLVDYSYFDGTDPYDQNGVPKYPIVSLIVPGERFRFAEAREAAALGGASLVALVLAGFVVTRRRPG